MTDTNFPISGAYRHMVRLTYSGTRPIKVGGFAQWLYGMTDVVVQLAMLFVTQLV